jgi:hypothetical protein
VVALLERPVEERLAAPEPVVGGRRCAPPEQIGHERLDVLTPDPSEPVGMPCWARNEARSSNAEMYVAIVAGLDRRAASERRRGESRAVISSGLVIDSRGAAGADRIGLIPPLISTEPKPACGIGAA